jgi:hypothetical protein
VAFLVRRRAAESGEDYSTALQGLLTDAMNGRNEAWGHLQDAMQDGRRAAGDREQAFEDDLASADVGAA